jgi:hypothetical protein
MSVFVGGNPPPYGNITSNKTIVDSGETVLLNWDSQDVTTGCYVEGTNGQNLPGESGTDVPSEPLTNNTTFVLWCDNDALQYVGVDWVEIIVNPDVTLSLSPAVIDRNGSVVLTWDTNGNDPAGCAFSGGGLSGSPAAMSSSMAINNITAQTTFKLTCGSQFGEATVFIRPQTWEP